MKRLAIATAKLFDDSPGCFGIAAVFFVVVPIVLGISCCEAAMESRTYNALTGADTTWWDALWVELRVQDAPRSK